MQNKCFRILPPNFRSKETPYRYDMILDNKTTMSDRIKNIIQYTAGVFCKYGSFRIVPLNLPLKSGDTPYEKSFH